MTLPDPLPERAARFEALEKGPLDALVIGGGITGAGLGLDLRLRGLRVAVIERGDWAGATSSASSRLIHGGLRYLEQLELSLVRDSCLERGLLMRNAAGMVWPERFLFPLYKGAGPGRLKLAAGLGLYTLVSLPRALGLPRMHGKRRVDAWLPGARTDGLLGGGSYLDGASDDSRLTLAVIATAMEAGCTALSRVEATAVEGGSNGTRTELHDRLTGDVRQIEARRVILCGGPFTEGLRARAGLAGRWVQPTRGTHILVPRERLPTSGAVIFPSPVDGRIMFLIPWPRYTVIGTTDLDAEPDAEIAATYEEVRYLLDSANGIVPDADLDENDVVSSWAGLRPLLSSDADDPSARSREERVECESGIYTIAGGKLTGYRSMAEKLGARIARDLGKGDARAHSPTRDHPLRGALEAPVGRPAWSDIATRKKGTPLVHAWNRRYAGLCSAVEEFCGRMEPRQTELDPETLLGEVDWAVRFEDCLGIEDFLLRRTDLGYGRRMDCEAMSEPVLSRLSDLLSWSPERRAREEDAFRDAMQRIHGWRGPRPLARRA